jgi:predicted ATPase
VSDKRKTDIQSAKHLTNEIADEIQRIGKQLHTGFFYPHTRNEELSNAAIPHVMEDIVRTWAGSMAKEATTERQAKDAKLMRQVAVMLRTSELLVAQVCYNLSKLEVKLRKEVQP